MTKATRVGPPIGVSRTSDSTARTKIIAGRYELQELIGTGGSAEVFQARDLRLNRPVAVKLLKPLLATDAEYLSRFEREATSSASLNHPNVVAIYDYGQDGTQTYLVMEHVTGGNLKERIVQRGRLSAAEAISVATQVLSALVVAHGLGLVHRDVKPQNVLFGVDGTAKLADFGIVQDASGGQLTGEMMAIGSAAYIAPEQATGQRVGPGADVYGVGLLLYEMLTGKAPFEDGSGMQIAYRHVNETPTSPRTLNPDIPVALDRVVMRALEKTPADRFPSAQSMIDSLRGIPIAGAMIDAMDGFATRPMPRVGAMPTTPPSPTAGAGGVAAPVKSVPAGSGNGRRILFPMILGIVLGLGILATVLGMGALSSLWTLSRRGPTSIGPGTPSVTATVTTTPQRTLQRTLTQTPQVTTIAVVKAVQSGTPTLTRTTSPSPSVSATVTASATATVSTSPTSTATLVPRTSTPTNTATPTATVSLGTPVGVLRPVITLVPTAPGKGNPPSKV